MQTGLLLLLIPLFLLLLDKIYHIVVISEDLLAVCHPISAVSGMLITVDVDHDPAHLVILPFRIAGDRNLHPLVHLHDDQGCIDDEENQQQEDHVDHGRHVHLRIVVLLLLGSAQFTGSHRAD